jgi:hypothetical protein
MTTRCRILIVIDPEWVEVSDAGVEAFRNCVSLNQGTNLPDRRPIRPS